ncbi:MAG TPA: AgmX/PglI C-terminal domain-containing protein [Polyangia bacterium]|nr:AgmX/PglI C-terminal domain-containing protein [Polyangia bacterium]
MKFVCERCQTKYSIADDKVRGKILKVRCKSCANIITVREEGARKPSSPALPVGGGAPAERGTGAHATIVAPRLPTPPPAPPIERRAVTRPPIPPPPSDEGPIWYMALDGNRTGPFTRKQLIDHVAPLPKDADVHVWNERLGAWKPPTDIPALANELHARRRPAVPVPPMPPLPAAPPVPPPFPGTPRRPTGTSFPVAAAAAAAAPARPTGTHGVVPAPAGGLGAKLPPPVGAPRRSPTGPIPRPVGLAAAPAAAVASDEPEIDLTFGEPEPQAPPAHARGAELRKTGAAISRPAMDSASLLQTPAPLPASAHAPRTNGVSHGGDTSGARAVTGTNGTNGANGAHAAAADRSDALNGLDLSPSSSGAAAAVASSPRLMSSESVVGWEPSGEPAAARQKAARIVVALLAVVGLSVVLLMFTVMKKPKPVTPPPPSKPATTDPLAAVAENPSLAAPPRAAPAAAAAPRAPEPAPAPSNSRNSRGSRRGAHGRAMAATTPPPAGVAAPAAAPADDANDKYRDTRNMNISAGSAVHRAPPSQGDISRVINNNRNGIKNCYQRALLRDNSLTHGKITVKVNIGISGRVKHVAVDGPTQFRALDPCIREVVGRWAFPPADEEYGTEFVYVFQGNE